jgi:hypothetical protein
LKCQLTLLSCLVFSPYPFSLLGQLSLCPNLGRGVQAERGVPLAQDGLNQQHWHAHRDLKQIMTASKNKPQPTALSLEKTL